MTAKILVDKICKSFGKKQVLKDISFRVQKGEFLVILGGSGSGKSVTVRTIIDLIRKDSGTILIDGKDLTKIPYKEKFEIMQKIGFQFQHGALFDSMPIWQNVCFNMIYNKGYDNKKARKLAQQKLQEVGLEDRVLDLYPSEISGGMQKRAAIARTIAHEPDIMFFDEPTSGLDPIMSATIMELIIDLSNKLKSTSVIITHDMKCATMIPEANVVLLVKGEIVWSGKSHELKDSDNPYVHQFVNGLSSGPIQETNSSEDDLDF